MGKARRAKSKHAADNGNSKIFGKVILIFFVIIIIAIISLIVWYNMSLSGTGTSQDEVSFDIELGSGTDKIANVFKIYVKLNNISNFKAGNYTITKDMTIPEIAKTLQSGILFKDTGYTITFVEGKPFSYIAKTIEEKTNNTEQDVYNLLKDEDYIDSLISEYWFITNDIKNENIYYNLEGYLFPDTYAFENENVTVKEIFKTMLDQMEKILDVYKTDIQTSEYSVHELLSMASVIENEAMYDKDRKNVSSVLYNRLNANMSLGCDVTTYYAFRVELGSRDLNRDEINTYNPYNTRGPKMEGKIPVGPISSVGKASIEAAIYPNNTNYLFFVADKARTSTFY